MFNPSTVTLIKFHPTQNALTTGLHMSLLVLWKDFVGKWNVNGYISINGFLHNL